MADLAPSGGTRVHPQGTPTTRAERADPAESIFRLASLLLFAAVTIYVTYHHEPWRDEADAWLIARDDSLAELWRLTAYVGNPFLWFVFLMPFAKSGFPYQTELVLNNAIIIAAGCLLLWRAPFSKMTRFFLLFSYHLAFEYGVVGRSYSVNVLLLFAIASLYPQRSTHPATHGLLIALLCNTNVPGFFVGVAFVLILTADLALDRKEVLPQLTGIAIASVGALVALVQLIPPPDGILSEMKPFSAVPELWYLLENSVIPTVILGAQWASLDGRYLNGLVLVTAVILLAGNRRVLFFYLWSVLAFVFVFAFRFPGSLRHAGLFLIVLVTAHWMHQSQREAQTVGIASQPSTARLVMLAHWTLLNTCLIISSLLNGRIYLEEVRLPFSGSKEMASFILDHRLDERPIAAFSDALTEAVLPYLPKRKFWYAGMQSYGSHMMWDARYEQNRHISYPEAFHRIQAAFPDRSDLLILFSAPIPQPERLGYRLLYATEGPIFAQPDERYYLYERVPSA